MALAFAVMHLYNFLKMYCFWPFLFFYTFLKSGMDKSTEWSQWSPIPVCPMSLMCFFNRGDTEVTNSSKILCSMFVYDFDVNLCQD